MSEEEMASEEEVKVILSDDEPEDPQPLILKRRSGNHTRSAICARQNGAAEEAVNKRARSTSTCGGRELDNGSNATETVTQKNMMDIYHNFFHKPFQEKVSVADIHPDSTQLELVSTDNGEVKVLLIFNNTKYYTKVPSLDAVLEAVEDKFHKEHGIINREFSVKKLVKELCECVLQMNTESSSEPHLLPISEISKKSNAEIHTSGKYLHQINSNNHPIYLDLPDDSHEIQNVAKNPTFVEDITRGEERQPISLVNENGVLELPKFFYISKNVVYNTAYVNFSLARISDHNCCSNCSGDCLSAPANCACTTETRGDFAYTAAGLVEEKFLNECIAMSRRKESKDHLFYCENCPLENSLGKSSKQQKRKRTLKPCKGHLMRKFIKECWAKCGCSRHCGNRVVQRGITVKLQVFQTPQGKGWGLRTLQELEKGTFVCEYVGEIVTNEELHARNEESGGEEHTYPVLLDADWAAERHLKDEEALCLDATKFGNVARFINHRCYDANLVEIPVEVETPDHHYYHLAFFTTRKVEVNEELNWDYGIDFDDETHPIKAFECKCGSFFCRMKN